jgi:hypothetical protein
MIKVKELKVINAHDWDKLVEQTYGRPYSFQQQEGGKDKGHEHITVPCKNTFDYKNDKLIEKFAYKNMGVSFKAWLERDPKTLSKRSHSMFYPHVSMVINDLYAKGLLKAGEYIINIDW